MDGEGALLVDHRMAGVGAARRPRDDLRIARQRIGDLALPLVAPLSTQHNRDRHRRTLIASYGHACPARRSFSGDGYPRECSRLTGAAANRWMQRRCMLIHRVIDDETGATAMLLAIDLSNTNTKIGLYADDAGEDARPRAYLAHLDEPGSHGGRVVGATLDTAARGRARTVRHIGGGDFVGRAAGARATARLVRAVSAPHAARRGAGHQPRHGGANRPPERDGRGPHHELPRRLPPLRRPGNHHRLRHRHDLHLHECGGRDDRRGDRAGIEPRDGGADRAGGPTLQHRPATAGARHRHEHRRVAALRRRARLRRPRSKGSSPG